MVLFYSASTSAEFNVRSTALVELEVGRGFPSQMHLVSPPSQCNRGLIPCRSSGMAHPRGLVRSSAAAAEKRQGAEEGGKGERGGRPDGVDSQPEAVTAEYGLSKLSDTVRERRREDKARV